MAVAERYESVDTVTATANRGSLRIVNNRRCTLRSVRLGSQRPLCSCHPRLALLATGRTAHALALYWGLDAWPRGALSPFTRPGSIHARSGRPFPAGRSRTYAPNFVGEERSRGCQDQTEAPGQDPGTVLPGRRGGLAHQAGRAGHRGDRQVPPEARAVAHRDRLGAGPVLAVGRRAADRA